MASQDLAGQVVVDVGASAAPHQDLAALLLAHHVL